MMISKKPNLIVRACTKQEELKGIKEILDNYDWYATQGYNPTLPQHEAIELIKKKQNVNKTMQEIFKNDFGELYSRSEHIYSKGITTINQQIGRLDNVSPRMKKLGLKVFPQYDIKLTQYGPGGSYGWEGNNGIVNLQINSDGKFRIPDPIETILHEIIHLGIEESIVEKFGLPHWTKERMVDLIVSSNFKDVVPEYYMQKPGDTRIDKYLNSTFGSLSSKVRRFKEDVLDIDYQR